MPCAGTPHPRPRPQRPQGTAYLSILNPRNATPKLHLPEPIAEAEELRFIDRSENRLHNRFLDEFILQGGDAERSYSPIWFRDFNP